MKKKLILITAIILGININVKSQCQEDKTIITSPANPVNSELITGHRNINTWNWGNHGSTGFYPIDINQNADWANTVSSFSMWSPFHSQTNDPYRYLWIEPGANPNDVDWHWEDGWELMWLNLGRFPNGNEINTWSILPAHESSPYFVLYNRYTGKLRFFGNHFIKMGSSSTPQNVDLEIRMSSDNKSGMFRHLGSFDVALDQPTKFKVLYSNNQHPNSNQRFYSTDFQLGYDPCMCEYASELSIWVQENSNWQVNLHGRSITMNGSLYDFSADFLTNRSWYEDSVKAPYGGSLIYKKLFDLTDKYEQELAVYEQKLAEYKKPENVIIRKVIEFSKTATVNTVSALLLNDLGVKNMVISFMKSIDPKFDETKEKDLVKGLRKTADALLGKGYDFLSKQVLGDDIFTEPVMPTMPTASFSEMFIGGSMTHSRQYGLFSTYAPGSFKVVDPNDPPPLNDPGHKFTGYNYPIYNKPTGLYALMKTPKIAFGSKLGTDSSIVNSNHNFVYGSWSQFTGVYGTFQSRNRSTRFDIVANQNFSQDIVFHLDEKLIYKLNRNLDINDEKSNILVSFQIELENKGEVYHYYGDDKVHQVDVSNTNLEILSHENFVLGEQKEKLILEIPWNKIENSGKMVYGGKINISSSFKYVEGTGTQTESHAWDLNTGQFLGINYTNNDNIDLASIVNEVAHIHLHVFKTKVPIKDLEYTVKSIKMKVMTDLTFDQVSSKGGEINTTQVFTYLIYDPSKNIDLIESNGRWLTPQETENFANSVSFPPTIHLGNVVLNPSSQFVTFNEGTELYVRADQIFVNGTLTVAPGYKAVLYATEKVELQLGATIHSDILIRTGDRFQRFPWNPKTLEATNAQIQQICSNTQEYKANQSAAMVLPRTDPAPPEEDEEIEIDIVDETLKYPIAIKWSVYPNPNNGQFNIQFNEELPYEASVYVYDLTGRSVHQETITKGRRDYQINTNGLVSGIYMVTILQGKEKQTVKMIVNNG